MFLEYFLRKLFFGTFFSAGRNFFGCITIFHRGGGFKRRLRLIDHFRSVNSFGVLVRIFRSRCNTACLGLVCYFSGFFSLIITCSGMVVGQRIYSGYLFTSTVSYNPFTLGSSSVLRGVPLGLVVCLVELYSHRGAQILRAAGLWGKVIKREFGGAGVFIRGASGVFFRLSGDCLCVLGRVSNVDHKLFHFSKAGEVRNLGFRPVVRGEAMNPIDHPHGGRTRGGRIPVTPWGRVTKGKKTVYA